MRTKVIRGWDAPRQYIDIKQKFPTLTIDCSHNLAHWDQFLAQSIAGKPKKRPARGASPFHKCCRDDFGWPPEGQFFFQSLALD
ncbi:MAG: hypothetical protein ABTQ27_09540 [Amaricoccus sp.]